jgi:hypothetical protein
MVVCGDVCWTTVMSLVYFAKRCGIDAHCHGNLRSSFVNYTPIDPIANYSYTDDCLLISLAILLFEIIPPLKSTVISGINNTAMAVISPTMAMRIAIENR